MAKEEPPVLPWTAPDPRWGWYQEAPNASRYVAYCPLRAHFRNDAINGTTLLIESVMPRSPGFMWVVLRAFFIFLTSSAGDTTTNNTQLDFRVSDSGVLGTYTTMCSISTSAAPVAGETVNKGLHFVLDGEKVIHVLVTLNAAGVNHDNDDLVIGLDLALKRTGPETPG